MSDLINDMICKILMLTITSYNDYAICMLVSKGISRLMTTYINVNYHDILHHKLLLPNATAEYVSEWVQLYVDKRMYKCVSIIYAIEDVPAILRTFSVPAIPTIILILADINGNYRIKWITYKTTSLMTYGKIYNVFSPRLFCSMHNYVVLYNDCIKDIYVNYDASKFEAAENKHFKFICNSVILPDIKNLQA